MSDKPAMLTFNDKQYPMNDLSQEARVLVQKIKIAQGLIEQKKVEEAILSEAYDKLEKELTDILEK